MTAWILLALAAAALAPASAQPELEHEVYAIARAMDALLTADGPTVRPSALSAQHTVAHTTLGRRVPEYVINLDDDPAHRYDLIVPAFVELFKPIVDHVHAMMSPSDLRIVLSAMGRLHRGLPSPYREEIAGIAQGAGLPVGLLTLLNVFYEMTVGCASIVAEHVSWGGETRILHGRNLDYSIPGMRAVQIQAKFTRRGRVIYTGSTFLGYVGLPTGMRPGSFSISLNQHMGSTASTRSLARLLLFRNGREFVSFFFRDLLEQQPTFSDALQVARTTKLFSPAYITMAGTTAGEGAVVTHEPGGNVDTLALDSAAGRWYLIQMNHDHWKQSPQGDRRLEVAEERMQATSPDTISIDYLYDNVMSAAPVLHGSTIYTTIMSPATDLYHTTCRNDCKDINELLPLG